MNNKQFSVKQIYTLLKTMAIILWTYGNQVTW